ncbi:MAG: HAD-IIB family hydrolase [Treponema sp.]|nr:HAD-IIB family hydrolase [Treponema sp.]
MRTAEIDPAKIKALAIDLDGTTLLPDSVLGCRTARCLRRLVDRGIQIIVCTGRAPGSSRRYCEAIDAKGPMVFFNGAMVAEMPGSKPVGCDLLPLEVVAYGADIARDMDIHYQVFFPATANPEPGIQGETLAIEKHRPESEFYQKHTGITPIVADIKDMIARPGLHGITGGLKAMFIADPSAHKEVHDRMAWRFGGRIYMVRTHPTFLEVMTAGVSKGRGLKTVMELRGLNPQDVMAFGDEENDLPMFAAARFSAAPANATEKVREAADFVFGPNTQEGLAAFLEGLF